MMRIILSQFVHPDASLELAVLNGRGDLFAQEGRPGAWTPVPPEIRADAEGMIHYPANTTVDGSPEDYPRLRALVRSGVGFDSLDLAAWGRNGVAVFNVPDYGTSEVADHAIALMLALARGTATYHERLRADPAAGWSHLAAPAVRRLRDAVFGIVGLGRIGLAAALRARGFGMRIAFYDPYLPSGTEIAVGAHRCRSLEELMSLSDVVSLHAPATEETRGLIAASALAAAKPGLILVNTARGSLVDLGSLYDALKEGRIAGAALDVLPNEPPRPEHPLIAAWQSREPWLDGRLTLSPHAAFYSPASLVDMRTKGMETLIRFLTRGDLADCVNRDFLAASKRS
jgi:D-3-phosphoglycerate dehydrogenase/C-terminal binding protein